MHDFENTSEHVIDLKLFHLNKSRESQKLIGFDTSLSKNIPNIYTHLPLSEFEL